MASNTPEPDAPQPGGLQSMLARLRGMVASSGPAPEPPADEELLPTWDVEPAAAPTAEPAEPPLAVPVEAPDEVPEAQPVTADAPEAPPAEGPSVLPEGEPELVPDAPPEAEAPPLAEPVAPDEAPAAEGAPPRECPLCQAPRSGSQPYCEDCGFIFPPDEPAAAAPVVASANPARVKDRYEACERLGERGGVSRFRGLDHGAGSPVRIVILRAEAPQTPPAPPVAEAVPAVAPSDEVLPGFDDIPAAEPAAEPAAAPPAWPGLAWEREALARADHPSLPAVLDGFVEDGYEYLIEELPVGRSLWDAWDDPDATAEQRFGWLRHIAEALQGLHRAGALLEGLRPDIVCVTQEGQARLTDLSDLLPLPVPADAPVRATHYTAPELVVSSATADARADLYSFGAMLYALHVGRELTDTDFERQGSPKPFVPRFPDIHPVFGRLVSKTFCRDVNLRFPSDEAAREDPTGFTELIRTLEVCRRTLDNVRLEIACWTTTGMVRTGNEDGFALLHAAEARQDDLGECALVFLCDGMGGYEAGEVAAAMAIQSLRKNLLQQKPFAALAGRSPFSEDSFGPDSTIQAPFDAEGCKRLFTAALKEANKLIYSTSRPAKGKRVTMGCTAEVVFVNGRYVVVGHVGDSRTYHLSEGRLLQLTRDQTLVNRLVELGTLSPEEAEDHPRKNELSQAVGGQPDVEPGLCHGVLKPGDWVVVCSDGVTNHVTHDMLKEMLQSEATSAETAARRLVNLVNIEGATDNATVVVIRAT